MSQCQAWAASSREGGQRFSQNYRCPHPAKYRVEGDTHREPPDSEVCGRHVRPYLMDNGDSVRKPWVVTPPDPGAACRGGPVKTARQVVDAGMTEDLHNGRQELVLVLVRQGRVLFVELKAAKGELTEDQWAWFREIGAPGQQAEWFVWRPADLDAALAELAR